MDKQYEVLCVSQFTLQCILKGNKPDYHMAMPTEQAESFYNNFLEQLRKAYKPELIKGKGERLVRSLMRPVDLICVFFRDCYLILWVYVLQSSCLYAAIDEQFYSAFTSSLMGWSVQLSSSQAISWCSSGTVWCLDVPVLLSDVQCEQWLTTWPREAAAMRTSSEVARRLDVLVPGSPRASISSEG